MSLESWRSFSELNISKSVHYLFEISQIWKSLEVMNRYLRPWWMSVTKINWLSRQRCMSLIDLNVSLNVIWMMIMPLTGLNITYNMLMPIGNDSLMPLSQSWLQNTWKWFLLICWTDCFISRTEKQIIPWFLPQCYDEFSSPSGNTINFFPSSFHCMVFYIGVSSLSCRH